MQAGYIGDVEHEVLELEQALVPVNQESKGEAVVSAGEPGEPEFIIYPERQFLDHVQFIANLKRQCPDTDDSTGTDDDSYCSASEYTLFGTPWDEEAGAKESDRTADISMPRDAQGLEALFRDAEDETAAWHALGYPSPEEMWGGYPSPEDMWKVSLELTTTDESAIAPPGDYEAFSEISPTQPMLPLQRVDRALLGGNGGGDKGVSERAITVDVDSQGTSESSTACYLEAGGEMPPGPLSPSPAAPEMLCNDTGTDTVAALCSVGEQPLGPSGLSRPWAEIRITCGNASAEESESDNVSLVDGEIPVTPSSRTVGTVPAMLEVAHRPNSPRAVAQIPDSKDVDEAPQDVLTLGGGKFIGLLIWGKFIERFFDGKVWEVRKTPPRKGLTPGSRVSLIECRTRLAAPNSKNLWRICFTATFEGYETCMKEDWDAHYSKHRVTPAELAAYLQQRTMCYFWKFKDVALMQPAQYLESDPRVIWVDYATSDVQLGHPSGTSTFSDAKRRRLG